MKNDNLKLKKTFLTFFIVIFIFYIFIFHLGKALAQSSNYYLTTVPYQTREDLDVLFAQSSRILDYFEGEGVEEPIFLSIITEPQKQNLTNKNFNIRVLDSLNNLNDIESYTLFYHPQPDQSNLLTNLGKVFVVSKHYTLLKTTPEKPFKYEGVVAKFFIIPFAKEVVTPPYRTKTIVPTKPPLPLITPAPLPSPLIKTILFSFFLSFIITGVVYLFFQQRKKKLSTATIIIFFVGVVLIISFLISKLTTKRNYPVNDLEIKETEEF